MSLRFKVSLDIFAMARVVLDPCSLLPLKSKRKQSHDTQRLYFISAELSLFSEEVMNMEVAFKHGNFYFCK